MGKDADLKAAMEALRDPRRRREALARLIKLGDPRATPALIECLAAVRREIWPTKGS